MDVLSRKETRTLNLKKMLFKTSSPTYVPMSYNMLHCNLKLRNVINCLSLTSTNDEINFTNHYSSIMTMLSKTSCHVSFIKGVQP